jgi:hypothetical protein
MPDSVWLCPSRGRPGNIRELRAAWDKVTGDEAVLLVAVDDDDPELPAYRADGPVRVMRGPQGQGAILNALAPEYAAQYEAVGSLGDDHRPRTPGWAGRLLAAPGSRMGVAYGDDQLRGQAVPTAALISSPVITALGYMAPPGVAHLEIDTFWRRLGEDLGCLEYCPDVILEHCHHSAGKAPWDEGYARVNSAERYSADRAAWDLFLRERWPGDLIRLKETLGS